MKALDLFIFIGEPKDMLNEYTENSREAIYASHSGRLAHG